MRKAILPNGLKFSQLEDVDFREHHAANAKPDSNSDSDHDSGTDLTQSSSLEMIHLAQILRRMMKCRLCWPKRAAGFGPLAMCFRASFALPKILWMTVLCQGIGA